MWKYPELVYFFSVRFVQDNLHKLILKPIYKSKKLELGYKLTTPQLQDLATCSIII